MMAEGTVYAVGRPEDVITCENIKHVYNVDAKLVDHNGRPHMILLDNDFTEDDSKTLYGSYVLGTINDRGEE